MRYEAARSHNEKRLVIIYREGQFEALPEKLRRRGPWQVGMRGEIARLKAEYRLALAKDGFVAVNIRPADFAPEA